MEGEWRSPREVTSERGDPSRKLTDVVKGTVTSVVIRSLLVVAAGLVDHP
jgi:hypothetical protein